MNDRKVIGYRPIYEPQPGSIVTQAFVLCSRCGFPISAVNGPMNDAVCLACIGRPSDHPTVKHE